MKKITGYAITLCVLLMGGRAFADDGDFFLAASVGVVEYVGDLSDTVSTGGALVLGAGIDLTENLAVEVEGYGAWANIDGFGLSGDAESYGIFVGPKFSTALSESAPWGLHMGANVGYLNTSASASGFDGFTAISIDAGSSGFAWTAKVGADYYLSESLQLVADVRYAAIAEYSDNGSVAVTVGIRFFPGF